MTRWTTLDCMNARDREEECAREFDEELMKDPAFRARILLCRGRRFAQTSVSQLTNEDWEICVRFTTKDNNPNRFSILWSMIDAERKEHKADQFIDWFNTAQNEFGHSRAEAIRLRDYYVRTFAMRNVTQPIADCDAHDGSAS